MDLVHGQPEHSCAQDVPENKTHFPAELVLPGALGSCHTEEEAPTQPWALPNPVPAARAQREGVGAGELSPAGPDLSWLGDRSRGVADAGGQLRSCIPAQILGASASPSVLVSSVPFLPASQPSLATAVPCPLVSSPISRPSHRLFPSPLCRLLLAV